MTLLDSWALQEEVYAAVAVAVAPVPVTSAPQKLSRYVRIDGWTLVNPEIYRNREMANHAFFIHVFDAPAGGTSSLKWTKSLMSSIHGALKGLSSERLRGLVMEEAQATFEPRQDENHDAHGFMRYRVQLGA